MAERMVELEREEEKEEGHRVRKEDVEGYSQNDTREVPIRVVKEYEQFHR